MDRGKKQFKVIIAGGSIAGLSLANMLQNNDIDFIVLEAYPNITPQLGASIGLIPHGLRILDQLGMYDDIRKLVHPIDHFHFRNKNGKLLVEHSNVAASFMERHGYPITFLDRQMVLEVLYANIKDKCKVLTSKRVEHVDLAENCVTVTAKDGNSFTGDILVGSDGIHSMVRQEMWRLADEISPGYIPATMPCDYGCVFGISNPCPGIAPGSLHSVFRDHNSYLVLGGLNSRVYWFYFFNIGKRAYSPNIPRYTKIEEMELMLARKDDPILPDLKFGQIYQQKVSSTMTALPEYVFKKWHYNRIMTIGDAAHKFEPISGQGGNAAIETGATLVNGLKKALNTSSSGILSEAQLSSIFSYVQETRQDRVKGLVADANLQQRVEAMETPLMKLMALYLLPLSDTDAILFNASKKIPDSEKLDMFTPPPRERLIPFKDELARDPRPRGRYGLLAAAGCVSLSVLGYWGMHILPVSLGLPEQWMMVINNSRFPYNNSELKLNYTGIAGIDETLRYLVSAFMPGVAGWDKGHQLLQIYFLVSLSPLVAIWSVEACRKRNHLALISFTSIWAALYQLLGIAVISPLFYLAYLKVSAEHSYWWPLSRKVPDRYATTLLPALLIGYLAPTILMFLPYSDPLITQSMIAFWQPAPIYVNILVMVFAKAYDKVNPRSYETPKSTVSEPPDIGNLKRIYIICGALSVVLHFGTMYTIAVSGDPELSFWHVFVPAFDSRKVSMEEGLRVLWLADFWVCFAASVAWCCFATWDLSRVGRTNVAPAKATCAILLATPTVARGTLNDL